MTSSRTWYYRYNMLAALTVVLYAIILESEKFAKSFGALGATLLAFGIWVGFICLIKNYTIKANVRFGLPLLVLAIFYGLFYNPYKVRLQKTQTPNLYSNRPDLNHFLYSLDTQFYTL